MPVPRTTALLCTAFLVGLALFPFSPTHPTISTARAAAPEVDRSPVDVVLTPDERYLLTANQTSNTVSLVRVADGKVVDEVPCGDRPSAVCLTPDARTVLVSGTFSGDLTFYNLDGEKLAKTGSLRLSFEPRGIAIDPAGRLAYVALTTASAVAVVDIADRKEVARIEVGRWPRYLALSPDGSRLAVGVSGDGGVAVIDTKTRQILFTEDFLGLNIGQMQTSRDGKFVYFPWMVYRSNPITKNNIQIGWVLASRIARVRLDEHARRQAMALDARGEAVSDPFGLALSPDEKWLVCAASGTHELLVYRTAGLPLQDRNGPGDHIEPDLLRDKSRFYRIPVGGRPMFVRFAQDGKRVFVANYLSNAIQEVDIVERKVTRTFALGGPKEPSLARQGEAIFYDGKRSLDQWYSCHSCHYEGHTNSVTMDTLNDGRFGNFKTVLSLRNVTRTGPWTWHGWQDKLETSLSKSLKDSMLGPPHTDQDVTALKAYLETLQPPPNPFRTATGELTAEAKRGEAIFRGPVAGCARCHDGPYYTDNEIHEVGTGVKTDAYKGFNTPSLIGTHDRIRFLHDGRSGTLEKLLTGPHAPEKVTRKGQLSPEELRELIAYLKSL